MNRSLAPVALVLTTLLINACGGGSSSTSTNNPTPQSSQSGQFIDGPVKGVSYRRGTLPELFTTSTDGSFNFLAGERVEFRLGNISFGSIETSANTKFVTPRILARGNDSARINMARFLIALDSDQNPNNGIEISAAVKQAAWQYGGSNDFATLESNELAEFARVANGSPRRSLVSSDVAEKHLAQSEADISDGQYDYDYDDGTDSDNDGINDPDDQCPNSEPDAVVASNGCELPNGSNDDDNDEVINADDNCPAIANNDQADLDQDQRGDACDNDIDGDGLPNDDDSDPRNADIDSDGVKDGADNCPNSPNSNQADTDADGQGDGCDSDIDNDDIDNGDDAFPLDPTENSDNDQDGIGNNGDNDDDNDGTPDNQDAFPFDASENTDSDGDGTGNNADTDDDNDGTPDTDDAFPLDASEDTDTDGDSIGNNADNDDDNDGVNDDNDACPNTPSDSEVDDQGCASQTNDQAGLAVCTPDGSRCISTIQELGAPLQAAADQIYAGIISAGAPLPANGEVILHAAQAAVQGCDMLDPSHCLFPFPSDQFTVLAEADTPQSTDKGGTGRRLNFNALAMPRNVAGKPIDPTEWNRNDGFSPGQMILTYVPDIATVKDQSGKATGPIEGAVPITRLADYTASDAPIVVINTATGERHPVWAEIDLNAGIFIPADTSIPSPPSKGETRPALIIRPAQNFEENTRYIVALRKLKNNSGETIAAGPAFRVCRDGDSTQLPQLTQRCEQLERNVFDFLPQDIKRDELYLAWDFTVASERSLAGRLLHIRDDAFATLGETVNILPGQVGYEIGTAPTVSVDTRTENPNARIARRIEGTITVPSYIIPSDPSPLEGGGFNDLFNQLRDNYPEALAEIRSQCRSFAPLSEMCLPFDPDAPEFGRAVSAPPNRFFYNPTDAPDSPSVFGDGLPDRAGSQATMTRKYICNIPNSAFTTPARPSLYGHGLLGSRGEVNSGHVADMADAHNMMFCAVDWFGFSEGDIASIVAILLDVSNLPSLTDSSQQGMLNMMFLARAMKHPEGFAALSDFQDDAGQALFTTDEVYYDGNSQGGIMGGAVVAVSRDVNRGVLGVPGMNYSTLLRRSVDFDIYSIPLNLAYHDDLDRSLVFSLMEMLWERAENNGYAHHMGTASSANTPYPNTPDNELLLQVGFSDHQVTMWSADVMARTIHAGVDRQDLAFPNRHPDEQEYALLEDLTIANGAQYTNDRYLGSALAIFDASWDAAPDGRCAADSTLPAPIGNIPPRDPESMPDGQRNDDPHECARREPSAKCQKSHFLYSLSTVLDVNGITRDDLCPPLPAIQ